MAPFGRHFLKARLKNRCEKVPAPGQEVQVWVCQEEKIVCGVRKRTTCLDVVQALLEDHKNVPEDKRLLCDEPQEYCLMERWKGFERVLPPSTRILRLWEAWGDEKPFVQFVLVRTRDFISKSSKRADGHRGTRPKSRQRNQDPREYIKSLPIEQQRRMVRKAFRKLEKIRKEQSPNGADKIDSMVQLIISQDHTIQQQIHRMKELDLEIDFVEQQLCMEGQSAGSVEECTDSQLQEFLYATEGIDYLDAQVRSHEDLIGKLSGDIEQEMLKFLTDSVAPEATPSSVAASDLQDHPGSAELAGMHRDLEQSMRTGVSLHAWVADLEEELGHSDAALRARTDECQRLAAQLSLLEVGSANAEPAGTTSPGGQAEPQSATDMPCRTPTATEGTDTDSDTGISSTHSQDSLSPYRKKPSPLDTDV